MSFRFPHGIFHLRSVVLSLARIGGWEEVVSGEDRLGRPEERETATRWPEEPADEEIEIAGKSASLLRRADSD